MDVDHYRWWLLRCLSGKEAKASEWLRGQGFHVCAPFEQRFRKPSRHVKASGKRIPFRVAVLTGYLIVGIGPRTPQWSRIMVIRERDPFGPLMSYGIVPVTVAETACRVRSEDVAHLNDLDASGRLRAPLHAKYQHRGREYEVGEAVEVCDGPFEGFTAEVKAMKDGCAKIELLVFGRETQADIPMDSLVNLK